MQVTVTLAVVLSPLWRKDSWREGEHCVAGPNHTGMLDLRQVAFRISVPHLVIGTSDPCLPLPTRKVAVKDNKNLDGDPVGSS